MIGADIHCCEVDFPEPFDPLAESLVASEEAEPRLLDAVDENQSTTGSKPLQSLQTKKRIRGVPVSVTFRVSVAGCGRVQIAPSHLWTEPPPIVWVEVFRPPRVS